MRSCRQWLTQATRRTSQKPSKSRTQVRLEQRKHRQSFTISADRDRGSVSVSVRVCGKIVLALNSEALTIYRIDYGVVDEKPETQFMCLRKIGRGERI
jgi:hypothetical protein